MPGEQPGPKRRNWYKLATIVLSAAMVVIMFLSTIYYRKVDERERRAQTLERKIEQLLSHKADLAAVPTVRVSLLTLENSGLPESAFGTLPQIPAVVRIQHVSGGTLKAITVVVTSSAEILAYMPESAVEDNTHSIDADKKRIVIDIPQLRRGGNVQGTIMCKGIGQMSSSVRIDQGRLVAPDEDDEERGTSYLTYSDAEQITPLQYTSQKRVDEAIDQLRKLTQRERHRPLFLGLSGFTTFVLWGFVPLLIPVAVLGPLQYFSDRKADEQGKRIAKSKEQGLLELGKTEAEVRQLFGTPRAVSFIQESGESFTQLSYEPSVSVFFSSQPDVFIKLKDGKVIQFEYKGYGDRGYL